MTDYNYNYYHVDPASHPGDASGRYPENFVRFPRFLKPLIWGDSLSRALRGKPAYLLGDSLLKIFDSTGPLNERWGTRAELSDLRDTVALFSRSLDNNPYVSPIGRVLLKQIYTGNLKNRAEAIAFYEKNREFIEANGKYKAPLLVTGFPRTGSTLLYRLLSEDPNSRSPYTYEMEKVTPPLKTGEDPLKDPRIEKSAAMMATISKLAPGFMEKFAESHLWSATEKEEAFTYMQFHSGLSLLNCMTAGLEFSLAMHQPEVAPALFKYEHNFFMMLDAYRPAKIHWVNKAPTYAPYFGYLFTAHPDAHVVVTHRHPSKNLASICRLLESWHIPFDMDGSFDKLRYGKLAQKALPAFWNGPLEWRTAHPEKESQIVDCLYQDLFSNPIGMVRSIYENFGLDYTPEFENRMKIYLENNKQGKYGRHKYANEEYGIDPQRLFKDNEAYFLKYGYGPDPIGHD